MSTNAVDLSKVNEEFIDSLPKTDEKIINKYQKFISNSIAKESEIVGIQEARRLANLKFGKGWRGRLELKKLFSEKRNMSYF